MSHRQLKAFIRENPSLRNLMIVSNREPYVHKKTGKSIKVDSPAGGLTAAVDEVMRSIGGKWIAWGSGTGDRDMVNSRSCIPVPPQKPSYTLKRVWLDPDVIENYYHGYSNQVLWPLCHIALDRVYFKKIYWNDYNRANSAFADAVLEEADEESIVWIHDYQLCMVPQLVKEKRPELTVAHFWHIPWPDYSVFRICPQSNEILEALLHNDLIGFQLPLFSRNFMDCVRESLEGADVNYQDSTVSYKGRITRLKASPISVDFGKFNSLAQSLKTLKTMELYKKRYNLSRRYIGVGVDRLEYTKGLIKRLQAIDLFFERYPKFRGQFTFLQIAVPTRIKEPYISYKARVEGIVRKINRKYGSQNWNPIIFRDVKAEHEDLAVFYRLADVAIISSVYDGMNLVAKEFVSSNVDRKGVLLLSEFAGAAEELEGAILVNPYDIEEFSDCIKNVLELSSRDKRSRMRTLRRQVKEKDIYSWIADILLEIIILSPQRKRGSRYLFDNVERLPKKNIFLFLDYDGTLTPIVGTPEKAVLSKEMRSLIIKLNSILPVAIISGRSIHDIMRMVDIQDMIYAGNHGAEIWEGNKLILGKQLSDTKKVLKKIIRQLRNELSVEDGVVVEDKGITASIHYRLVNPRKTGRVFENFWSIVSRYEDIFRITSGKKVLEIRPHGIWNKGDAVKWIWKKFGKGTVPIYVGDDTTDEDAFTAIKGKGLGICIGKNIEADYYLKSQREIRRLLKLLGNL
jgi:alpha,alpha-trehalose-phosphate synthase [UDP-forming]/trehalose-phosphatase